MSFVITPALIQEKAQELQIERDRLAQELNQVSPSEDHQAFAALSRRFASLDKKHRSAVAYLELQAAKEEVQAMLEDPEMAQMAEEELEKLSKKEEQLQSTLLELLLPPSAHEGANLYLEIRAAAGGDEAAIFVGDLARAYTHYAQSLEIEVQSVNESPSSAGGYKEVVLYLSGEVAYATFEFEGGTHRVQRVPKTETQGRIHTSTVTVAIMPEVVDETKVEINKADLKVDTFRASGAGGQHVNKTDSAIRLTHIPSGIVVECQEERSQHKNRAKALSLLIAKLENQRQLEAESELASSRKIQVGTGDRSERIRTYNYPQQRVTDHRIGFTLHGLEGVMEGQMAPVVQALREEKVRKTLEN